MHFKLFSVAVFAVAATAAPAPAPQTVDVGALQAVAQNLAATCASINDGLSSAGNDLSSISSSIQGDAAAAFQQAWNAIGQDNMDLQSNCASLVSILNGATESFQSTDQELSDTFGK